MSVNNFLLLSNSKHMGQKTCQLLNEGNAFKINAYTAKVYENKALALESYLRLLKENKILILENLLPDIKPPPPYIYCKGHGVVYDRRVAVIGARQCSAYGLKTAYKLSYALAKKGFTIVSGLAMGIDASAHRAALDAGGSTIAVLGSGILNAYPKSNQKLFEEISLKGKILSEYGFYGQPHKHHFPFRNRLISGLAQVIIVVEAKLKSGTMITVKCGLEQGKTVYAVPGPVDSPLSQGTHHLIEEGAHILTTVDNLIENWPILI